MFFPILGKTIFSFFNLRKKTVPFSQCSERWFHIGPAGRSNGKKRKQKLLEGPQKRIVFILLGVRLEKDAEKKTL